MQNTLSSTPTAVGLGHNRLGSRFSDPPTYIRSAADCSRSSPHMIASANTVDMSRSVHLQNRLDVDVHVMYAHVPTRYLLQRLYDDFPAWLCRTDQGE
jgi:hypothetical protein